MVATMGNDMVDGGRLLAADVAPGMRSEKRGAGLIPGGVIAALAGRWAVLVMAGAPGAVLLNLACATHVE